MEKALTADQVNKLKETVRQRFDELYQRIGTNRQSLATKVLMVDQSIIKELNREKVDAAVEKDVLGKVRDIERMANNQLPHVRKPVVTATPPAKAAKEAKPAKETKPKAKKK
jgi:hypothetical protein